MGSSKRHQARDAARWHNAAGKTAGVVTPSVTLASTASWTALGIRATIEGASGRSQRCRVSRQALPAGSGGRRHLATTVMPGARGTRLPYARRNPERIVHGRQSV